jgi:chloride channel 7
MLLPVLVAILVAKAFADTMEPHSYYHAVMEANNMPFLASNPHTRIDMDLLTVKAVMASPVQTIPRLARIADLENLLRETSHNGFPVVQPAADGLVCVGLITRLVLLVRTVLVEMKDGRTVHRQDTCLRAAISKVLTEEVITPRLEQVCIPLALTERYRQTA